ncbi:hypothetical protein [Leifsonia aquatica]|uniref:hypothetical protein n=1 Tax=Leifsonia aquatica TaxID=144185 RepID=UPI00382F92B6
MTASDVAGILTALGVGTLLPMIIKGVGRWVTGRAGRQRDAVAEERRRANAAEDRADRRVAAAEARADEAQERADMEARNRGRIAEAAAEYRRTLQEHGIDPDAAYGWPALEKTIPRHQLNHETETP